MKLSLTLLLAVAHLVLYAQVKKFQTTQLKRFYSEQHQLTDSIHSNYYAIGRKWIFYERDFRYAGFIDSVNTYYTATGKLRSKEFYTKKGIREGGYTEYHGNGGTKETGIYRRDRKHGRVVQYFEDGVKHFELEYFSDSTMQKNSSVPYRIISYWTKAGDQLVKEGNGYCECLFTEAVIESGKVLDGLKDSVWSGYEGQTLIYSEKYDQGKFLEGQRFEDGISIPYRIIFQAPEFAGGYKALERFIEATIRYPKIIPWASQVGTVDVSFLITDTGLLENITIIHSATAELDAEAIRVLQLTNGKWKPGKTRGAPVFVQLNLPMRFVDEKASKRVSGVARVFLFFSILN
jgi:TonB family protein